MIKYKDDPIKEKDVWWTRTTAIVGKIFGMVGLVIEELRAGAAAMSECIKLRVGYKDGSPLRRPSRPIQLRR